VADNAFDLDIRGLLNAQEQLDLRGLTPQKRRRLLNNVAKRVRTLSRKRIGQQQNLDGSAFAPRKDAEKGKKKMETGLGKLLQVTRVRSDEAVLGWRNNLTRWVAGQQHHGVTERRTAAQMRAMNTVAPGTAATPKQAKRLRRLDFKVRMPGKKKLSKPSTAWIVANVSYAKAGLLIRILDNGGKDSPGAKSWDITLPKRQFLGASNDETRQLVSLVLQQTLNSPS